MLRYVHRLCSFLKQFLESSNTPTKKGDGTYRQSSLHEVNQQ
jgi:hypothetical protein